MAPLAFPAVLTLAFYVAFPQAYCVENSTGFPGPNCSPPTWAQNEAIWAQSWVSANKRQNLCFAAKEVENQAIAKGAANLCRPAEEVRKKLKPLPRIGKGRPFRAWAQ